MKGKGDILIYFYVVFFWKRVFSNGNVLYCGVCNVGFCFFDNWGEYFLSNILIFFVICDLVYVEDVFDGFGF